jgi:DNA-binding transcriptional ArsR family regulator
MRSGPNAHAILDALGDPIRRVIYQRLRRKPSNVTQLAKGLPVTRSAVSRHLQVLKGAGLVEAVARGPSQIYSVCAKGLQPLIAWIEKPATEPGRNT